MARAPIFSRKAFFERVNRNTPILRLTDYNIVEIEGGVAVETRGTLGGDTNKMTDMDLLDNLPDSITLLSDDDFRANFGGVQNIQQTLRDFSY